MKCIIGTKRGMTQIFREDGTVVPVTRVQAGPCTITQVKSKQKDGVDSIQVGFGTQKQFRVGKAQQGHLQGLTTVRHMHEFRTEEGNQGLKRGDVYTVSIFEPGEKVSVTGTSKGKGFQGVVKRHGFAGAIATHGTKDQVRMPGSIGATGPARVFKGMRMGGHMGDEQVTVKNLEIAGVDVEANELLIKGALPGAKGGVLYISTCEGTIEVSSNELEATATPEVEQTPDSTTDASQEATEAAEPVTEDVATETDADATESTTETGTTEDTVEEKTPATEESEAPVVEESTEETPAEEAATEEAPADAEDNEKDA